MSDSKEESIRLYYHKLGPEIGVVELVVPSPEDTTDTRMICRSESGADSGVIYSADMDSDDYASMCKEADIETAMGSVLESDEDEIQIVDSPEDPPLAPPDDIGRGSVSALRTPKMWTHSWGRCCCVDHGSELIPVTTEAIRDGDVPWWGSPFTPYQLDLIQAAADPDEHAMHVLDSDDRVCGACGHFVWCVIDEDVPEELPDIPEEPEVEEPLVPEQNALEAVTWKNKLAAWQLFRYDEHNQHLIESSGLPISRASDKRRFEAEKGFARINEMEDRRGETSIFTIKAAFYAALGNGRNGTWADFDLDFMRLVKGLEGADVPVEVMTDAGLDPKILDRAESRGAEAESDADADVLNGMMEEDEEDDERPEDPPPPPKKRPAKPQSIDDPKLRLIAKAQALQSALGEFIEALGEVDCVPKKARGG
jgi:hypothetical protein